MKTVFFDVDTQLDFLYPGGALYVPGAETIAPALAKLTNFASTNRIQIVSTADAHSEDDPEFKTWRPHCVAGTLGQHKAGVTQVTGAAVLGSNADVYRAPQIIVEKRQLDAFSNLRLQPLLTALAADRYVLYGVVTELCVSCAAAGLLKTGARVELVTDAIKSLSAADERTFLDRFLSGGGALTTTAAVISG